MTKHTYATVKALANGTASPHPDALTQRIVRNIQDSRKPPAQPTAAPAHALSLRQIIHRAIMIDFLLVFSAGIASKVLIIDRFFEARIALSVNVVLVTLTSVLTVSLCYQAQLYQVKSLKERSQYFRAIFFCLAAAFLVPLVLPLSQETSLPYTLGWVTCWLLLSYSSLLFSRWVVGTYARMLQAEGGLRKRIAVYGFGQHLQKALDVFAANAGTVSIAGVYRAPELYMPESVVLASEDECARLISSVRRNEIDDIVVALPLSESAHIQQICRVLNELPVNVQVCPFSADLPIEPQGCSYLDGAVLFDVQRRPLTDGQVLIKSIVDYALSGLALIFLAPLFALIAAAIKLDGNGPVFFIQRRNGYNERVIKVVKFRTMRTLEDGKEIRQAAPGDERVTRVGRLLRRWSLDELPQLINVLRGEMSLVGPRPHALAHNSNYLSLIDRYACRHRVKPGITGWAQVNGLRGETSQLEQMRKRVEKDLYYIEHCSLGFDLEIMMRTLLIVFRDKAAY